MRMSPIASGRAARRLSPLLLAAAIFAALAGLLASGTGARAQLDESNPAVYWRLERERQNAARRAPVVIQRPTRMTRGVAPRPGYAREVPAGSAAAAAASAAAERSSGADRPAPSTGIDSAVQPDAPAVPEGPAFVIGVFGDNVGQMLARGLSEAYADSNVTIVRRARENSGLVREDYYDWPKAIEDFLESGEKIDLAVMMIGSNDRQQIRDGGQTVDVLSDRWKELYRARVEAIAQAFKKRNVPLIWVGMTVMKNERLSSDLAQFNEIYRDVAQRAGATFVDVWEPFVDERNRFILSGPDLNGHVTRIRTGDGVHFTRAGARKLAHFVEGDVKRYLDRRAALAKPAAPPQPGPAGLPEPGTGGELLAVPAPDPIVPRRPAAGPVVPLTATALSPGGELARPPGPSRQSGPSGASSAGSSAENALPPPARPGRADDFSWPRQ